MNQMSHMVSRTSWCASGVACLILLLCVCVVTQMLGVPATLIDLLNSDVLAKSEPVSEDCSALSPLTGLERPHLFRAIAEFHPVHHLPILITSVFHPPSA